MKHYRVVVTPRAQSEIAANANYLARQSLVVGERFLDHVDQAVASLTTAPRRSTPRGAFYFVSVSRYRSHLLWLTVDDDTLTVTVHRLLHSANGDLDHVMSQEAASR